MTEEESSTTRPEEHETEYRESDVRLHFDNPFRTGLWMGLGFFTAWLLVVIVFALLFGGMIGQSVSSMNPGMMGM